jgi:hypothetical protein
MLKVLLILEDGILDAEFNTPDPLTPDAFPNSGLWRIRSADSLTGKQIEEHITTEQLGAIVALAVGGEEGIFNHANAPVGDHNLSNQLYAVAEPVVKDWPKECRPIP